MECVVAAAVACCVVIVVAVLFPRRHEACSCGVALLMVGLQTPNPRQNLVQSNAHFYALMQAIDPNPLMILSRGKPLKVLGVGSAGISEAAKDFCASFCDDLFRRVDSDRSAHGTVDKMRIVLSNMPSVRKTTFQHLWDLLSYSPGSMEAIGSDEFVSGTVFHTVHYHGLCIVVLAYLHSNCPAQRNALCQLNTACSRMKEDDASISL